MTTVALLLFAAVVLSTLLAGRPHRAGEEVEVLELCPMGHRVTGPETLRGTPLRYCKKCPGWYERTS